jgi:hypothetical protein
MEAETNGAPTSSVSGEALDADDVSAHDLTTASPDELLRYALTLDEAEPWVGVQRTARRELGLLTSLGESARPGTEFDLAEVVPVLEGVARRFDVAMELYRRSVGRRTKAQGSSGAA